MSACSFFFFFLLFSFADSHLQLEKPSADNSHKELTCISPISLKANKPRHGTIWQRKWDGMLGSRLIKHTSPDRHTPGRKEEPASPVQCPVELPACTHALSRVLSSLIFGASYRPLVDSTRSAIKEKALHTRYNTHYTYI